MLEEPDERIVHVRICGGAGWVTAGSTRKYTKGAGPKVAIPRDEAWNLKEPVNLLSLRFLRLCGEGLQL